HDLAPRRFARRARALRREAIRHQASARARARPKRRRPSRARGDRVNLLQLDGVCKSFGGIKAVTGVTFAVAERSIFGLIGPNGTGKTTVFNLVTGVYRPDAGSIRFNGIDLADKKPASIASAGIARTFQNIRLFGQMSVLDNVLVAGE